MTIILKDRKSYIQKTEFDKERFDRFFNEIVTDSEKTYDPTTLQAIKDRVVEDVLSKKEICADKLFDLIIREANEKISTNTPEYTYLSASTLKRKLYKKASKERGFDYREGYGDYYTFVKMMTEKGIYGEELINSYTKEELDLAGSFIDKEKDKKFTYSGLFLLNKNYLAKGYDEEVLELPQERYMSVALYLMHQENREQRMDYVKEAYWALSNHYVGLATPTMTNSARPMGTLSSCHIMTMGDSMQSIMDVIKDSATFSQNGAGLGIILNNLRANGSWIRGYKGRASGVMGVMKLANEIANYVNQLGVRKGGLSLYLPVYHFDIYDFLDARLKTGSQERRAHSIFTAVNLPDEFMRRLNSRSTWTLFDPYEVKKKLGFDLNDMYDKKRLQKGEEPNPIDHEFTYHYRLAENSKLELSKTVEAKEVYGKIFTSRKTGGTPYLYFSDTAARMNPNSHKGMPKGSNLCSEIIMNNSEDEFEKDILLDDGTVVQRKKGEDLVTCNLSSKVLYNIIKDEVDLQRVSDIQFRMLDNVITLNRTVVQQATHTNHLYRAVGSGAMGLATLLAEKQIQWDSEEANEFVDKLFEEISYCDITASYKLAMEKGSYPLFEGSEWNTGEYFEKRGYFSDKWVELREKVSQGIRNGYLSAVAPTGSNSVINGSVSPALDAMYEVVYQEEKAGMRTTMIPPNYSPKTMWFYKSAFEMDEMWSLKIIAAAQKHIDQSISHNMHLHKSVKASEMLRLDNAAWEMNMKTIYYTYQDTNDINRSEGCTFCEA
ncbi:ribonucleoside-diphosphate reductase subunit alpha [Bacillus sp. S13(2024)]|uniref:ribonucleoside-diphosphate reductase subunit alpha n=1 Tax=Bacillus sp. S13(2024) TaxID=3162885 RepID=UPI003D20CE16